MPRNIMARGLSVLAATLVVLLAVIAIGGCEATSTMDEVEVQTDVVQDETGVQSGVTVTEPVIAEPTIGGEATPEPTGEPDCAPPEPTGEPDGAPPEPTGEPDGPVSGYVASNLGPGCVWSGASAGMAGVPVTLTNMSTQVVTTTTTDSAGCYYFLKVRKKVVHEITVPQQIGSSIIDCDVDGTTPGSIDVVLAGSDISLPDRNFGYIP